MDHITADHYYVEIDGERQEVTPETFERFVYPTQAVKGLVDGHADEKTVIVTTRP